MDEIALSAPAAQRDDGHGGDRGGQRRRGDAFLILSGVRNSNIAFVILLFIFHISTQPFPIVADALIEAIIC